MNNKRSRLICLHQSRAMTRPVLRKMLKSDPSLIQFFSYLPQDFIHYFGMKVERANQLYKDLHDPEAWTTIYNDSNHYTIITIDDPFYPLPLRAIQDPPIVLYAKGNLQLLSLFPSLSVVGTRYPSKEAKAKINYIIGPLIDQGWTIVSGMAKGIDGLAHELAIVKHGYTIAVLGGGFDYVYPSEHKKLFESLTQTQLVLTEYPPSVRPIRYHFPERNRIISGLSFGTIVIEAKAKSGSLITVEQALDQGREVYAVPGSPLSTHVSGCHKMIQDGAKLVQNTHDISEDWEAGKEKWCRFLADFDIFS
ncbi:DNA-processing protein DprA [Aquibacillus salsiterrae]|uniref:DNA-processing protein DprA n=1 Tax=Aquibacillus salsiterrae TaxID=2950439 RepID=A0A9X4AE60_9BACI|nr:DNA-processing protein DprA [Aquibacillus salsiterrae]MDC3416407.1 DNA-processing protein DprA [Aquibacillus salsiterrae]